MQNPEQLAIRFPSGGGGWGYRDGAGFGPVGLMGALPGTDINWVREVGDPTVNAVVWACLRWITDNLPEPELMVKRRQADGTEVNVATDPAVTRFLELLRYPNPQERKNGAPVLYSTAYDREALLAATARSYCSTGNAYWLKDRDNLGRVQGLYWVPHWLIAPAWPSAGGEFISHYIYRPGNAAEIRYPVKDVIHFRYGLDQHSAGRLGVNRLLPVYREIAALNEGGTWTASLLRNGAVPPVMLTPKEQVTLTEEVLERLKQMWARLTKRDGRGKPLVPSVPMEVQKLGLNPQEMALDKVLHWPSLLVCGALGIHPAAVFLAPDPKGLDNGGQHEQARKQSYQDCLIPMLKCFARTLTTSLLVPDLGADPKLYAAWDFSQVSALAEDETEKAARWATLVGARIATRNEARAALGLKPMAGLDEIEEPPGSEPEDNEDEESEDE